MSLTRDFVATVFIVYKNKLLFHFHKKLKSWLPVGGHIEKNELPTKAAIRETYEESGLKIELYQSSKFLNLTDIQELIIPNHIIVEKIEKDHEHVDLIYYAKVNSPNLNKNKVNENKLIWVNKKELEKINTYENVKVIGRKVLEILGE